MDYIFENSLFLLYEMHNFFDRVGCYVFMIFIGYIYLKYINIMSQLYKGGIYI